MYGLMDLVVIIIILIIVFGAKWLPATGEAIGRALARRAARSSQRSEQSPQVHQSQSDRRADQS